MATREEPCPLSLFTGWLQRQLLPPFLSSVLVVVDETVLEREQCQTLTGQIDGRVNSACSFQHVVMLNHGLVHLQIRKEFCDVPIDASSVESG